MKSRRTRFSAVLAAMFRRVRIHRHSAVRILDSVLAGFFMVVMDVLMLSHSALLFDLWASQQKQ